MGTVWESYLLISMCLVNICLGQTDYLCHNSTVSGQFHVSILTSSHFGESCDKSIPTGIANPIGDNILTWAAKAPSLKIGLRVIDTCGSISVNTKAVCETVPWSRLTSGGESNEICFVGTLPNSDAVVTTTTISGEDNLISTLTDAGIPLLLAKDGYHQKELSKTSAVYLGHSMEVVSRVIAKFMTELKWDFITVVHSDDRIGNDSYQAFKKEAERYQICIDPAQPGGLSSTSLGSIGTEGVVYLGSEGIGYQLLTGQDLAGKMWITTLDVRGLNINNGRVYSVLRSGGDLLTDALAIFGEALTMTVNNGNCSAGSPPSCFKTSQFQQSLIRHTQTVRSRNLTYTIGSDGDVSSQPKNNITYEVYRHNGNVKVATVSFEAEVMRMPEFQEEHSLCLPKNPTDTKCLTKCRHLNNDKYLYIHGDWTIVVSLPIHENEDPEDRWSCQNFTKTGLFRTVAARFAFNYLRKNGRATFNGKTFGMLVIDSCGDKLKTAGKVYDIIRGSKEICDRDGNCLDHNSVVAMIADYSSSVTRQIQTILRRVPLIQMAYGASSVALSNRNEYPYFLRTNPPDDLQAHFMVELMKKINKKASSTVTAVNLLYTDGLYGRTAAEKVREYLKKAGICVHMDRKVNESGTNDFNQLRDDMLADTSDVRLTIVFMDSHHLSDLMDAIKQKEYRIFWLSKGYSFVFSDTWNDDKELLNKYGDIVKGSFSFKFNADFQSLTFGDYLTNRKLPTVEHENPWMSTLEQLVGDCKLPGNFLGTAKTLCTVPRKIIQYRNESYSLHLMKAITATVHGLRQIVNADVHNPNVLFDRKKIGDRYESLLRMKISRYLEEGRSEHQPFTVKTPDSDTYGNGRVGFSIYNIDNNQEYAKVLQTSFKLLDTLGEFERIPEYFRDGRVTDFIISKSDREHCVKSGNTGETDKPVELDGVTIGLGVTGAVVVLLIIVVVVLGLKFLKTRRTNRGDTGDTDYASYNDYLSVEQQKAIRKVAHPPGIYPPSTADQYFTPNNKPILGEDNRGYAPSICEPTTASTTHKPYDGASTSGASQSTNTGESNNGVRLTGDLPKPAPRSMNNDDGCGTTRSQQSSKSAKQQIFVDEITNV